jgi:hypothetical protein
MTDPIPLSTRWWRTQIETHLKTWQPANARWVQEHPRQTEIVASLTTDAIDLWLHATTVRNDPTSKPSVWTSTPPTELVSTVLATVLDSPELWANLDEDYPHTTTVVERPMMLATIPASGPTSRRLHQGR